MRPIPEAIVVQFGNFNPTPDDIESVKSLIEQILKNPNLGTPIPFSQPKYEDCYVAFTADGKWRVVYRLIESTKTKKLEPVLVSVEPQE
jgi:hypothetical protein